MFVCVCGGGGVCGGGIPECCVCVWGGGIVCGGGGGGGVSVLYVCECLCV